MITLIGDHVFHKLILVDYQTAKINQDWYQFMIFEGLQWHVLLDATVVSEDE